MGYNIVSPNEINKTRSNGLGIKYVSNGGQLFRPIHVDIDQALENLKNLLLTRLGERVLQPTFGCRLFEILFQPNVFELKDEIKDIIIQPVNFWLPYITIDEVDVVTNEDDPNLVHHVQITITFSISSFETRAITITSSETGVVEVQ
jgi:phage baseplate assembly protein W